MKKILTGLVCLTSLTAFAQNIPGNPGAVNTSSTAVTDARTTLKNAGLNLVVDSVLTMEKDSNDNEFRGGTLTVDMPLSYKLTDKDSFRILPEFSLSRVHQTGEASTSATKLSLVEGRYKRGGILVQDKHGINGSAEIRGIYVTDVSDRNSSYSRGLGSVRLNAGRTWGKFSLDATLRQDVWERRKPSGHEDKAVKYLSRLYLAPAYSITDSWAVSVLAFYNRTTTLNDRVSTKYYVAPSVAYTINSDVSVAAFAEFVPFKNNDGRHGLASRVTKDATYNLELTATVF